MSNLDETRRINAAIADGEVIALLYDGRRERITNAIAGGTEIFFILADGTGTIQRYSDDPAMRSYGLLWGGMQKEKV